MAYISTTNNQSYRIEIQEGEQSGQGKQQITLDALAQVIDWRQLAPLAADAKGIVQTGGRYSLLIDNVSYDVFARRITKADEKASETYEILIAGQRFEVKVEDERTKLLAGLTKGGATSNEATVTAPMPGLVVGVPYEQGASVTQGQTVVILEAMKMENDLASPISGTVKELRVTKGQTVEQGAVLAVISKEETAG